MAIAKQKRQPHSRTCTPAAKSSAPANTRLSQSQSKEALERLYTHLQKTNPGSVESKRLAEQIIDALG
jgi:hypothetical protein